MCFLHVKFTWIISVISSSGLIPAINNYYPQVKRLTRKNKGPSFPQKMHFK